MIVSLIYFQLIFYQQTASFKIRISKVQDFLNLELHPCYIRIEKNIG